MNQQEPNADGQQTLASVVGPPANQAGGGTVAPLANNWPVRLLEVRGIDGNFVSELNFMLSSKEVYDWLQTTQASTIFGAEDEEECDSKRALQLCDSLKLILCQSSTKAVVKKACTDLIRKLNVKLEGTKPPQYFYVLMSELLAGGFDDVPMMVKMSKLEVDRCDGSGKRLVALKEVDSAAVETVGLRLIASNNCPKMSIQEIIDRTLQINKFRCMACQGVVHKSTGILDHPLKTLFLELHYNADGAQQLYDHFPDITQTIDVPCVDETDPCKGRLMRYKLLSALLKGKDEEISSVWIWQEDLGIAVSIKGNYVKPSSLETLNKKSNKVMCLMYERQD